MALTSGKGTLPEQRAARLLPPASLPVDEPDTCPCCSEVLDDATWSELFMGFIHGECMFDCGEWT